MFTLTDKDKALYYMQTANTQTANTQTANTQTSDTQTTDTQTTSNKSTASYDIRIAYADEDKNEYSAWNNFADYVMYGWHR